MFWIRCAVLALIATTFLAQGVDKIHPIVPSKPISAAEAPIITDLEASNLELLVTKKRLAESEYALLQIQMDVKSVEINSRTSDLNKAVLDTFVNHGVDTASFDLVLADKKFKPKQ